MKRLWLSLVCALALGAVGCDGGGNTPATDAGPRDSGPSDSGMAPVELPVLQAADGDTLVAADLSCLGVRTAPTAGDATDLPVRSIQRGLMDMARPATTVRIFPGNQILSSETCDAPACTEVTTDGAGDGTVNLAADGWFAYQVIGDETAGTSTTAQVNVPATPAGSGVIELSVISRGLFESALGAANVQPQVGTSYFTGTARDCMGRPLVGARIRVFGGGGEIVGGTNPRGPRFVYWPDEGPFPLSSEPYTSLQGRYAGGNVDPEDTLRLELWAVRAEGEEPSLIACEEFGGQQDQVTVLNVDPLRADAPASCSN